MTMIPVIVLVGCGGGGGGPAERLFHSQVTTYTDGSAVPAAKIPTIVYNVYYGTSPTGPWTLFDTHVDNVAATIPAAGLPAYGSTMYYTADATLDGVTSENSPAFPYTPR